MKTEQDILYNITIGKLEKLGKLGNHKKIHNNLGKISKLIFRFFSTQDIRTFLFQENQGHSRTRVEKDTFKGRFIRTVKIQGRVATLLGYGGFIKL